MPKNRLTRNAINKSLDAWDEYLQENDKKNSNEKLDELTIINHSLDMINNNLVELGHGAFLVYTSDRNDDFTKIIKNGGNVNELKERDEQFHNFYDNLLSEFLAHIFIARDTLDQVKGSFKDNNQPTNEEDGLEDDENEIDKNTIDKYEKDYQKALDTFKKITQIDPEQFDKAIDCFTNAGGKMSEAFEPLLQEFDKIEIDDYSDITKKVEEEKAKEVEEQRRLEQEALKKEQQEKNRIARRKENQDCLNNNFDEKMAKDSLEFFNINSNFKNNKSLVDNVTHQLKKYTTYNKNQGNTDKLLENKANEKKAYYGAYLKIKENYNNKNWFKKIFSFKDRKAMKELKEQISKNYNTSPEMLDNISNNYLNSKSNLKKENSKVETRTLIEGDLKERLARDVSERVNNDITIEKNNNDLEINKDKEIDI